MSCIALLSVLRLSFVSFGLGAIRRELDRLGDGLRDTSRRRNSSLSARATRRLMAAFELGRLRASPLRTLAGVAWPYVRAVRQRGTAAHTRDT